VPAGVAEDSTSVSLAPFATFGWSTKPGAEATNTSTFTIWRTRSSDPMASRSAESA
jgi:hypothetical protein